MEALLSFQPWIRYTAPASEKSLEPRDWQYGPEQAKQTREGNALIIGGEAALEYHSPLIAAMILSNRFKEPARLLETLRKRNIKRLIYPV